MGSFTGFCSSQTLEIIFNKIQSTNVCDVVISLVIMAVVFVVKELNDRFKAKLPVPIPIEVIMVRGSRRRTRPPPPPQRISASTIGHDKDAN